MTTERLSVSVLDLALSETREPYVLIRARKEEGTGDLLLAVQAGNGAEEMIGAMPLMMLTELAEEHNPLLPVLRTIFDDSDNGGRKAILRLAEEVGMTLGGGREEWKAAASGA